jgi:hypothetical protein
MPRTAKLTALDALRALAATLPASQEIASHGMPNFRIAGGKVFAMFAANHHGDGRVALWLPAASGVQHALVGAQPRHYFVPPYVGKGGWIGVRLDRGIAWARVCEHVRAAWTEVAPAKLAATSTAAVKLTAPNCGLTIEELDPMFSKEAVRAVAAVRRICLALPATTEGLQFGKPVWQVAKRTFAQVWRYDGPVQAGFWVGVERQSFMTSDARYTIPPYLGHNGWIALDVTQHLPRAELESLARESYAHFAPKRILKAWATNAH